MNYPRVILTFIAFLFVGTATVSASQTSLDPSFGNGGKVIWSPNNNSESRAAVDSVRQNDGKIVMVGGHSETAGNTYIMAVRFNTNGSIDTTFGTNGIALVTFGANGEYAVSIDIQSDGKLIICGRTAVTGGGDIGVARLNTDGTYDNSFYVNGRVVFGHTLNNQQIADWPSVVKVGSDGKIWVGGSSGPGPNVLYYRNLARLNSDGTLDQSFGTGGRILEGLGSGSWSKIVPNDDGTIIASGSSSAQFSSSIFVSKIDTSGSAIWSWGKTVQPGCYMSINALAKQADGKVLVGGGELCRAKVTRLAADGSIDETFSMTQVEGTMSTNSIAIQPDGKILTTFGYQSNGDDGFSMARYNTNGSADTTFGPNGITRIRIQNASESARDIFIQPDGKFLLAGSINNSFTSGYRFGLVRFLGLSVPPIKPKFDYDGDGKTDMAIYRPASADWWYLSSANGQQINGRWGEPNVIPLPSDFDGDGRADYTFFLPANSTWYRYGSAGSPSFVPFGSTGDKPLMGDYDGDSKSDVSIFRPSDGNWWWQSSVDNVQRATKWGISTDIPTPGDFDADGKTDFAVYRPSTGVWYIINSATLTFTIGPFGLAEDKPVAADYDGDGRTDIAVFRPSTGVWHLLRSSAGYTGLQFGISTDIPTPAAYAR